MTIYVPYKVIYDSFFPECCKIPNRPLISGRREYLAHSVKTSLFETFAAQAKIKNDHKKTPFVKRRHLSSVVESCASFTTQIF